MNKSDERLGRDFEALKKTLKQVSIDAIRADDFNRSRRLSEVMERLLALETLALNLTGADLPRHETAAEPPADRRGYPRFYRAGRTLYKEGMKQDGKSVYTQKVDQNAFMAICEEILKRKGRFKPAEVIDKLDYPSYQFYIVLNILQEAGLVDNPERGAYQGTPAARKTDVRTVWGNLEQRLD